MIHAGRTTKDLSAAGPCAVLAKPCSREQTKALLEQCDRVIVTASQVNVKLA